MTQVKTIPWRLITLRTHNIDCFILPRNWVSFVKSKSLINLLTQLVITETEKRRCWLHKMFTDLSHQVRVFFEESDAIMIRQCKSSWLNVPGYSILIVRDNLARWNSQWSTDNFVYVIFFCINDAFKIVYFWLDINTTVKKNERN